MCLLSMMQCGIHVVSASVARPLGGYLLIVYRHPSSLTTQALRLTDAGLGRLCSPPL